MRDLNYKLGQFLDIVKSIGCNRNGSSSFAKIGRNKDTKEVVAVTTLDEILNKIIGRVNIFHKDTFNLS